jgi:hypothetical protein
LARYHCYVPSNAELVGEYLWYFTGRALLAVLAFFLVGSFVAAVVSVVIHVVSTWSPP